MAQIERQRNGVREQVAVVLDLALVRLTGQLLARGQVVHRLEEVEDIEAWRVGIRRHARADRINVRTGFNEGLVWAPDRIWAPGAVGLKGVERARKGPWDRFGESGVWRRRP